ncbi:hypothetical protein MRB53_008576 [Persea americana]|uniref:Uncharacterized protein n=1 Tax=Persea americana TaxID=3435 RepID=A0ACC2MN88_PERAE|nr:hypothetical protein MRB53_008576 [Persea americana]
MLPAMSSPEDEENDANLPREIIMEILSRLSIHFLMEFNCVSKMWHDIIIHDPVFAALHHNRAIENHKNYTSLIFCPANKWSVIWPHASNSFPSNLPLLERASNGEWYSTATAINTFFDRYDGYVRMFKIVGSCNGLLCLYLCNQFACDRVYVCNPVTGEYITLPGATTTRTTYLDGFLGIGFGYDLARKEYKVVRLVCQSRPPYTWEAEIYTLGTDSWRSIMDFPGQLCASFPFSDVLVNGALHWKAEESLFCSEYFTPIVSLDMCDEQFRMVPGPSLSSPCISFDTQLMSWKGYLSIAEHTSEYYCTSGSYLWIMKEYSVKESWTKIYNIRWPTWLTTYHGQYWPFDDESVGDLQVPQSHRFQVIAHMGTFISLKNLFGGTKMVIKKWNQMHQVFCNSSWV